MKCRDPSHPMERAGIGLRLLGRANSNSTSTFHLQHHITHSRLFGLSHTPRNSMLQPSFHSAPQSNALGSSAGRIRRHISSYHSHAAEPCSGTGSCIQLFGLSLKPAHFTSTQYGLADPESLPKHPCRIRSYPNRLT